MAKKKLRQKRDVIGLTMLVGLMVLIGIVGLGLTTATKDSTLIKNVLSSWLIAGLSLTFLAASLFKGEILIPLSKIILPLGIYVGLAVVSTLLSRYKYASLRELASLLCAVMLVFVTVRAVTNKRAFLLVMAMMAGVAAISCLYGIAQHYDFDPVFGRQAILSEQGRSFSTMGHPNFFGSFLILVLLALLSFFYWSQSGPVKSLVLVLICSVTLCLFYTESRGAWLGLLGGLPAWFFLSVSSNRWRLFLLGPVIILGGAMVALLLTEGARGYVILWALPFWLLVMLSFQVIGGEQKVRHAGNLAWGASLLVAVVLVSNVFVDRDEIGGRMESAFDTEKGSVFARKVMWNGTLNMFEARPALGWGMGTFSIHFPRFRDPVTAGKIMPNTLHAHSEYMEVGAEMGIVGLAVFLWLIGAFLWESLQKAVKPQEEWQRLAVAGLAAGCVAILLQAAVSVSTRWVVGRFFLWLGIGLTIALGKMRTSQQSARNRGEKDEKIWEDEEGFYRIRLKLLRAPAFRVAVILLTAAVMVAGGWWGGRVFASAVLTRRGEGYRIAAKVLPSEASDQAGILEALNKKQVLRDKAIELYERAVELNPYNLFACYKLGHCYNLQGRLEESLRTYRRMAKLAPDGSDIHFNLGVVYANMRRWEESKEELETALSMKIGPLTRLGLARAHENLGHFAKAEEQYRALLATDPDEVRAMNGLAGLHLKDGDNEKAMELYERVVAIEPENADARLCMGLIYRSLGDHFRRLGSVEQASQHYTKSVEALEIALRKRPDNVPIRAALALAYADVDRFQDALAQLQHARKIKPNEALIYLNLGKVYIRMNEPQGAVAAFRRTMQIDPRGPWGSEALRELKQIVLE